MTPAKSLECAKSSSEFSADVRRGKEKKPGAFAPGFFFDTDGVGFEPTVRYERTHTFQACALNHSATRPRSWNVNSLRGRSKPLRELPVGGSRTPQLRHSSQFRSFSTRRRNKDRSVPEVVLAPASLRQHQSDRQFRQSQPASPA
jgi:hypothetical protein